MNIQKEKYVFYLIILFAALTGFAGCKGNATAAAGGGATTSADGSTATTVVSASNGGYVNLQNMRLIVPQGALDQDTQITASFTNTSASAAGVVTLGQGISLQPEGLQFLTPVQLELCYSNSEVLTKNANEKSAMVYYADASGQLIAMSGTVDQSGHCVTGSIEHFSTYIAAAQINLPGNTKPAIGGANLLPATPLVGIPLRVRTIINDFNGGGTPGSVVSAFLNYRIVGAPTYTRVALQPDTADSAVINRYYATIPAASVTLAGIQYYFEATDNLNLPNITAPVIRAIATTATAIRLNPFATTNISNGFARDFTLQANGGGWVNISKDAVTINVTGGIGTFSHTGTSKVTFLATTPGAGSLDAAISALPPVSSTINVQPGLLSSIQIMDVNKVIITAPVNITVNGTFQFDAVGYDMSGNVSPINPTFTITGGIGTINSTALFTAAATAPLSGTLTADIGGLSDFVNVNIWTIPSVVSTTPADASKDNMANTTFSVTFSEAMDTTTLNGNTGTTCTGSIQVSSDNFVSCITMTSALPVFSAGNSVAMLTPAANLAVNTYKVRVTTAAKSINAIAMSAVYTSVTGVSVSGWAWVSGASTVNAVGVYGTKGIASATNVPGARYGSISWSDASGNLYLFGGYGYGSTATLGYLNDLWKYDNNPASATYGQWTWISGSNTINAIGVYGTKGAAAAINVPGARCGSISWSDASGNLYLFGGYGYGSTAMAGSLNDLWKYDNNPASATYGQWTWISGSNTINVAGVYGTKNTAAVTNIPGARYVSISWSDVSGNLYLFGGYNGTGDINDLWKYDNNPTSSTYGQWTWISGSNTINAVGVYGTKGTAAATNVPGARHYSISWSDSFGNLYLFGGSGGGHFNDLWKYDNNPASATYGQWTWISGTSTSMVNGIYGTKGKASPTNMPGARYASISWGDTSGDLYLFGGSGYDSACNLCSLNDLWKYDNNPASATYGQWAWISGSSSSTYVGVYGTKNVPSTTNKPGPRSLPISWSDASGNLYLFGGNGYGSTAVFGSLNDLWKYQP